MTSSRLGRLYIEEAQGRRALVRLALDKGLWAPTVREAQECAELFLKGALRVVGVEPTRTHDVAEVLRREVHRFPEWFRAAVDHLATISTEMVGIAESPSMATSARNWARRNSLTRRTRNERSRTWTSWPTAASGF